MLSTTCRRSLCSCGADPRGRRWSRGRRVPPRRSPGAPRADIPTGTRGVRVAQRRGSLAAIAGGAQADEEGARGCQAAGGAAGKDGASRCGGLHRCAPPPLAPYLAPLLPAPTPRADPCSLVRAQRGTTASCSTTLCSTRSTAPRTATSPRATFAGFSTPTARSGCGSGGARRPTLRPHSTGTEVDLDEDEDEDDDAARDDDALIDEEGRRVRRRRAAQPHADGGDGVSEL